MEHVSRGMHNLVIAFTLVNVKVECSNSPRGNQVLALINTTEDYDNIEEAVQDIADEISLPIVLQLMILHLKLITTWVVTGSFLPFV